MNQIDLADRTAIVTGGAQGIGLAIASRFLVSGARVALWDRDAEELRRAVDFLAATADRASIDTQVVDVTDIGVVEQAFRDTLCRFASTCILVNSAGITGPNLATWEYPVDMWRQVFDVNVHGTFNTCRTVIPHLREQGYGRIINIASVAGKEGNPNASAYSASKAAVIGLTKSLAKETCDLDIAVNCITPAAAKTRIFDQMTEEHIGFMLAKIPRGRFVQVQEIAAMVAWMASAENSFTTGAAFDISGGRATY